MLKTMQTGNYELNLTMISSMWEVLLSLFNCDIDTTFIDASLLPSYFSLWHFDFNEYMMLFLSNIIQFRSFILIHLACIYNLIIPLFILFFFTNVFLRDFLSMFSLEITFSISIPVTSSFLSQLEASCFADLLISDSSPDRPLCSFHLPFSYQSLWLLGMPGHDLLLYLLLGLNTIGRSPKTYR